MTTNKKIPVGFASNAPFEVETEHHDRQVLADKFAELKSILLADLTGEVEIPRHQVSLEFAANEAASLAWTTAYPLLVFPGLLVEIAEKVQKHVIKQKSIRGRSEMLLAETV